MRLLTLVLLAIVLISGCTQKEEVVVSSTIQQETTVETTTAETTIQQAESDSPQLTEPPQESRLEHLKRSLREGGSSCTDEWRVPMTDKSLVIDPNNPDTIYIAVRYNGLYKSTDGGETWKKIVNGILAYSDRKSPDVVCYEIGKMVVDPTNSQRVLMAPIDINFGLVTDPYTETSGVWETLDGGESWHQIVHGEMNAGGTGALAIDPNNPQTVYFGTGYGTASYLEAEPDKVFNTVGVLYKTTNNAETWEELPTGFITGAETGTAGTRVFVNPKNSKEILLFTQSHDHKYFDDGSYEEIFVDEQLGILKSQDGGLTWTKILNSIPQGYRVLFDGDVSEKNFDHIFIRPELFGKFGHLEKKSFYSTDGGETFKETEIYIRAAKYDPHDETGNHMFGYSPWTRGRNVAQSNDAGATWQALATPKEVAGYDVQISDFEWDPTDPNTIYMAGTHASVWKSTDKGESWRKILGLDTLPGT